jgi:hypothetical protein
VSVRGQRGREARRRDLAHAPVAFSARLDGSVLFGFRDGEVTVVPPM